MNAGDDAGAITLLNRVIAFNGGEVEDFTRRATANASLNRYPAALADLDQAIARDPRRWRSYLMRAVTFQKLARFEDAVRDLDTAIELQPDEVELIRRRGYLGLVTGHFEAARADYEHLAHLKPGSSTGPFGRGVALYLSGRWADATAEFERQFQVAPADGITALWMVKASLHAQAALSWEQVLRRAGPEPEWAMVRSLLADVPFDQVARELAPLREPSPGRRTVGACEHALFLGTWAELRNHADARAILESARIACPADSIEGAEARTELARLKPALK